MNFKNIKIKFLFFNFICLFISIIIFVIIANIQNYEYTKKVNYLLGGIVDKIVEKYPNITEDEIISIINSRGTDSNILKKYGIKDSEIAILSIKDNLYSNIIFNIFVILFLDLILMIPFYIYLKIRDNKVKEITNYMDRIISKDYTLNIEENSEDELSYLRDELYKITVMLKEESYNATKEKDALMKSVADISHQLKTPLTSIRIMLDNLEDGNVNEQLRAEFIQDISKQIEWMNFLTISLLKLARFDAGVVKLKKEEIVLKEIFKDVEENLSVLLELKNQKLNIDWKENIKFIGDYNWQLEAITNIVKNCLEYSPINGKIDISYEDNLFYTKIEIKDYGVGIKKEEIKYIFDRFYKSSNSTSSSVGIGLSLAKTIIEKGYGYISVVSEVGKGTTFEIKYQKNV